MPALGAAHRTLGDGAARDDDAPGRGAVDHRPSLHAAAPRRRTGDGGPQRDRRGAGGDQSRRRGHDRPRGAVQAHPPGGDGDPARDRGRRPDRPRRRPPPRRARRPLHGPVLRLPRPVQGHRAGARSGRAACAATSRSWSPAASTRGWPTGAASAPSCASGYGDVARFTGWVPDGDVGAWFSAADLCVFPYPKPFASSGVLALAVAHGTPVLLSPALARCAGAPNVVTAPMTAASARPPHRAAGRRSRRPRRAPRLERRARRRSTLAGGLRAARPPVRGGARCRPSRSSARSGRVTRATKRSARRSARRSPTTRWSSSAAIPADTARRHRVRAVAGDALRHGARRARRPTPLVIGGGTIFKSLHASTGRRANCAAAQHDGAGRPRPEPAASTWR